MKTLSFALLFSALSSASIIGSGSSASISLLQNWFYAYKAIKTNVGIQYNITSPQAAISAIINGTPSTYADFTFVESLRPTSQDIQVNPNFQLLPVFASPLITQINIPAIANSSTLLVLSREAIAGIYMGDITNWRDPAILLTNPDLAPLLPNANITVIYRTDPTGANLLWSTALSAFSSTWKQKYGISVAFPPPLQALKNFVGIKLALYVNAAILNTPNSIGYVISTLVVRDSQIQYACLQNYRNETVCPTAEGIGAAINSSANAYQNFLINDPNGRPDVIDSTAEGAYPIAAYLAFMVSTKPPQERCEAVTEFYKFVQFITTDSASRSQTSEAGFAPLDPVVRNAVLSKFAEIQCNGQSVATVASTNTRGVLNTFLLVVTSIVFSFVLVLSIFHLFLFRTYINLVYTVVFVIGSIILLISPYVWFVIPTTTSTCQARLWLTSVGLSILLGTMFSRTWQLRDIYLLQKKGKDFNNLSRNITVRSSLVKLMYTLLIVSAINLLIVGIWTAVDPYSARFDITNYLDLLGQWSCSSRYLTSWLMVEMTFLLGLILFGVYVIYFTWSFQRQALIAETRWVLIALYNIILNLTGVIPISLISLDNDDALSVLMMVSIIFSGGGIVLAFLLPRSLRKLFGESTKDSGTHSPAGAQHTSAEYPSRKCTIEKSKEKEGSKTPTEELSLRLETPQANYRHSKSAPEQMNHPREVELLEIKSVRFATNQDQRVLDDSEMDESPVVQPMAGIQRLEEEDRVDPLTSSKSYFSPTLLQSTPPGPDTHTLLDKSHCDTQENDNEHDSPDTPIQTLNWKDGGTLHSLENENC